MPKVGCSKCTDGYIRHQKEPVGFDVEPCDCLVEYESIKESQRLASVCNIPERLMKKYTFDGWDPDEADGINTQWVLDWMADESVGKNWLFISGAPGSGKTYLSVLLAKVGILQERSVFFANVTWLMEALRPKNDDEGGDKPGTVLEKCKRADILILDDIGHEKSSAWVRERLYLIVNERWNAGKVTIFTSNYPVEKLAESVSPAVFSRVKGDSTELFLSSPRDMRITKH